MIQNLISDVAAGRHPWNPPTEQNDKKVDRNYIQQKNQISSAKRNSIQNSLF